MKIELFPTLRDIYPDSLDDHATFRSLLQNLNRDQVLIWCSHLNLHVSHPMRIDNRQFQASFVQAFFAADARTNAIRFINEHGADRVHFVHRGQLLELMRWASLYCGDRAVTNHDITDDVTREKFGKALLIASSLWSDRITDKGRRFTEFDHTIDARLRILGVMRQGAADTSLRYDPVVSLGRGKQIFEAMSELYPVFAEEFISKTGLTINEYYACILLLFVHYWSTSYIEQTPVVDIIHLFDPETHLVHAPHMKPIFDKYFELEAQTAENLKENLWSKVWDSDPSTAPPFNYSCIRQRPILRVDSRFGVMDPTFFIERAAVGPLFCILKGVSSHENGKIFDRFGKAFGKYAGDILKHMYLESDSLYSGLTVPMQFFVKKGRREEIIDASLNSIDTLILIEMKAKLIKDEYVLHPDHQVYITHLRERYGIGIAQLARAIKDIESRKRIPLEQNSSRPQNISKVQRVFPVLLVHDVILGMSFYQEFFLREFQDRLAPPVRRDTADMVIGRFRVAPLILMTIGDLEILESSIRNFRLTALLRDYVNMIYSGRMMSLGEYLSESFYASKLVRSDYIRVNADKVFEDTIQLAFPDGDPTVNAIL
ncbi:hypothetical protein [Aggregatilinea lenta]|uniref:hypothetical protein n=1 Tax=Aggregatilinea lenta TaxID=913108 RepID=UPI0013C33A89|nr:hypothetical protein [Aggregatilinea lenta]